MMDCTSRYTARFRFKGLIGAIALVSPAPLAAAPPPGYALAWADEFEATALDTAKWVYRTDSKHWSTQLPANITFANGRLQLNLRKENAGGKSYTGAGLISKQAFRYGYYETRMKTPPGAGWHSSFWMMKHDGSGGTGSGSTAIELDAIENDSITPLKYGVNTHKWNPSPHQTFGSKSVTTPSLTADYHVIGCEFTPTTLKYYFDDTVVQTVNATLFPHSDVNIWCTSIASYLGGTTAVDDTLLPATVEYEYVRYYSPLSTDPPPVVSITSPQVAAVSLADNADTLQLEASITSGSGSPEILWSKASGPGSVTFSNISAEQTAATFSAPGSYVLQCAASTAAGTGTAQIGVAIHAPLVLSLRQGVDDYAHTATVIRADQTSWNAGARDMLLVGRGGGAFRSVFSFNLTSLQADAVISAVSLKLKTSSQAGSGTIGNLELRRLDATPVEGTGISDGLSGANTGTGTGTTWLTRTGGSTANDLWITPGGDFQAPVHSSLAGYDATLTNQARILPSSPLFVAAAQDSLDGGKPLDLILTSTGEAGTTAFTRLCSDDDPLVENRPELVLTFTGNHLPAISTAPPPAAIAGLSVPLTGTADGADTQEWSMLAGPAPVIFANASAPSTTAIFPLAGTYVLRLVAANALGSVSRTMEVEAVPSAFPDPAPPQVTWTSPSTDARGSMPLGNGDIGLNAWVETSGDLLFYIGKTDSWEDNSRLAKVGLVRVRLSPALLPAGTAFSQTLDPLKGEMTVTATPATGQAVTIRAWVDANHPVAQVTVDGPPETSAAISFEPWRTTPATIASESSDINYGNPAGTTQVVEPDTTLTGISGSIGWYHRNERSLGPKETMEFQDIAGAPTFTDPILHRTFGAIIRSPAAIRTNDRTLTSPASTSHRFDIHVLTRHPATPEEWLARIEANAAEIEAIDFTARHNAHLGWWHRFWNRSHIEITPSTSAADPAAAGDVTRGYALQRFITACGGRGAYPIKFNGSIFTMPWPGKPGDADYRRWGCGYWWQNTRLPYAGLCTSGDSDMLPSLHRMYLDDVLPVHRYRAGRYYGPSFADTCFMSEVTYPWGAVFTTSYGWTTPAASRPAGDGKLQSGEWHKREWVGGLELAAMLLDYYDHGNDGAYLTHKILPAVLPILRWFDRYYSTDAGGKLVMNPSQALETWWTTTNPMTETAGLHAVVARLLALPEELLSTSDRAYLTSLRDKLPALPTRVVNGATLLAPAQNYSSKHNIELPELYAVYPFRLASFEKANASQGLAAYAAAAAGDKGHTGWKQDDLFLAVLGDTTQARTKLVARARAKDPGCRFPAFWGPNYDWTPDQCHGGVLMKAAQSLILQSEGGKIFVLPAWPADWNLDFKLHAPKQTIVAGIVRDGVLQSLTVTPASRRADVILGSGFVDPQTPPPTDKQTSFRQAEPAYQHTATILRSDNANWNSGARDQILVGKTAGGYSLRSVLSFPLTGLPANAVVDSVDLALTTAGESGVGTIGAIELRGLTATPVEGTGNGLSSSDGAGTGATWNSRSGGTAALDSWTTAGGDFGTTVLSSIPGFDATTVNTGREFASSPAFVAAARNAVTSGSPLDLMLVSPVSETGPNNNIARLCSDDHAILNQRPVLTVHYSLPQDSATYSGWSAITWPGIDDPGITWPDADPDMDGLVNLLEYALGGDPNSAETAPLTRASLVTESSAEHLAISFTRRKQSDVQYVVEFSPDLVPGSWTEDSVQSGSPVSLGADFERVTYRDPDPRQVSGNRFVRLKIIGT